MGHELYKVSNSCQGARTDTSVSEKWSGSEVRFDAWQPSGGDGRNVCPPPRTVIRRVRFWARGLLQAAGMAN